MKSNLLICLGLSLVAILLVLYAHHIQTVCLEKACERGQASSTMAGCLCVEVPR